MGESVSLSDSVDEAVAELVSVGDTLVLDVGEDVDVSETVDDALLEALVLVETEVLADTAVLGEIEQL